VAGGGDISAIDGPVAIVLAGGASLGAVQVGTLRALYERGIAPDLIVGASVGALNGAFIASRPATPDTTAELADAWTSLRRSEIFPIGLVTGLLGYLGQRSNLVSTTRLSTLVHKAGCAFVDRPDADDPTISLSILRPHSHH
jgi:NTE family protein